MVSTGYDVDVITGEKIMGEKKVMNDGRYSWTTSLIHYVEKYNLRLPKKFEDYVLNM